MRSVYNKKINSNKSHMHKKIDRNNDSSFPGPFPTSTTSNLIPLPQHQISSHHPSYCLDAFRTTSHIPFTTDDTFVVSHLLRIDTSSDSSALGGSSTRL